MCSSAKRNNFKGGFLSCIESGFLSCIEDGFLSCIEGSGQFLRIDLPRLYVCETIDKVIFL